MKMRAFFAFLALAVLLWVLEPVSWKAVLHVTGLKSATDNAGEQVYIIGLQCAIKGNRSRKGEWIYHMPGRPYYSQTRPEARFCIESDAQAAGYRKSRAY